MRPPLLCLALVAACAGSSEPPLTDATSLRCPTPGNLPFRLASSGFQTSPGKTIGAQDPHIKDQASDTLGNPGGAIASI